MSDAVMVPRAEMKFAIAQAIWELDRNESTAARTLMVAAQNLLTAASPSVGGWEDISTAPKDGTLIMIGAPGCGVSLVRWLGGAWIDEQGFTQGSWPTHWQSAPPPPSVSIDNGSLQAEDRPSVPAEGHDAAVVDRRPFADVFAEAYGWTVDVDGYLAGLVAGDMGYDQTDLLLSDLLVDAQVAEDRRNRTTQGGPYSWPFHEALMAFVSTGHAARPQPAEGCSSNEGAGK